MECIVKLFRFERPGEDTWNKDHTKIASYKQVNVCALDEQSARIKSKISEEYILVNQYELNEDW